MIFWVIKPPTWVFHEGSEKIEAGSKMAVLSWTYSVSSARFLTSNIRNKYVYIQQMVHKNGLLGNHSAIELYRVTYKLSYCGRYSVRVDAPWIFKTRIDMRHMHAYSEVAVKKIWALLEEP